MGEPPCRSDASPARARTFVALIALGGAALASFGCQSLLDLDTAQDRVIVVQVPGSQDGAAVDATGSSDAHVALDASGSDAGPGIVDGAVSDVVSVDAATADVITVDAGPCDGNFCEPFASSVLDSSWSTVGVPTIVTGAPDADVFSAPYAVETSVDVGDAGETSLTHPLNVSASATSIEAEVHMRIIAAPQSTNAVSFFALQTMVNGETYVAQLEITSTEYWAEYGRTGSGTSSIRDGIPDVALDSGWHEFAINISGGASPIATFYIDHGVKASIGGPVPSSLQWDVELGVFSIKQGNVQAGLTSAVTLRFDDLVVKWQ